MASKPTTLADETVTFIEDTKETLEVPKKRGRPPGPFTYFSRVKEAREAIKARAMEVFDLQMQIIKEAVASGKLEVAAEANQWIMEHMPLEDGEGMIDSSIDKVKEVRGNTGPQIQIGIALTAPDQKLKALPPSSVDGEVLKLDE